LSALQRFGRQNRHRDRRRERDRPWP
jgi:hypothetical protein